MFCPAGAIPMETIMRSSVMELIIGVTVAMGIAVVAASAIDIAVDYSGWIARAQQTEVIAEVLIRWRRPHDPVE